MSARKKILLGIILIAAALRMCNIFSDVSKLSMEAPWIWERNLISVGPLPGIGLPSGYSLILSVVDWINFSLGFLLGFFKSILDFDSRRLTDIQMFLFTGRLVNAIFGVGTVYLAYLIGKKIKDKDTGLIAAVFLSFMYMHIEESRYVHYQVALVFFIMLAFLFIMEIFSGRLKYNLPAGLAIGLGGVIRYTSFITVVPFILAHILRVKNWKDSYKKENIKNILLGACFVIVGFIWGYPLLFNRALPFFDNLKLQYFCLFRDVAVDILPRTTCWVDYLYIIYKSVGLSMIITFFLGILYCLFKRQKNQILLITYPIAFYVCLGSLKNLTPYYVLPLFPFIALISAYFLTSAASRIHSSRPRNVTLLVVTLILLVPMVFRVMKSDLYLRVKNNKKIIADFVFQHALSKNELLDSNQKLLDNLPIMLKLAKTYFVPELIKRHKTMDIYTGPVVKISGGIIFKERPEEFIQISVRSSSPSFRYGPPDIALIDCFKASSYTINVPQNCGEVIIRATEWKYNVPQKASGDIYLKVGKNDIKGVNLII